MELEKLDLEKHLIKMGMPILQDIMRFYIQFFMNIKFYCHLEIIVLY